MQNKCPDILNIVDGVEIIFLLYIYIYICISGSTEILIELTFWFRVYVPYMLKNELWMLFTNVNVKDPSDERP